MATEEHKYLSEIIKKTHALLRADCQRYGAEVAWKHHVTKNDLLQKYAESMRKLATECWTDNNLDTKKGTYCRIEWIKDQCKEYFFNGGREKYDEREQVIGIKINCANLDTDNFRFCPNSDATEILSNPAKQKISVLDVGSCYNPLGIETAFDVTAIDLVPAAAEVLQCDFLNVRIGKERILSQNRKEIYQLPVNTFDIIVFSLFLEYLPCSTQRYVCCKNAYELLKKGGVMVIVSPDSKHVNANSKLLKSWRYVLSKLGFMRIKYEKLRHIHCLVFRKCINKDVAVRWADLQHFSESDMKYICDSKIFIPQDFQNVRLEEKTEIIDKYNETDLANTFADLPFCDLNKEI